MGVLSDKISKCSFMKSIKISKYGTENLLQHEIGIKMDESQKLSTSKADQIPSSEKDKAQGFDVNENNENF